MDNVMESLKDPNIRVIGVYGMGGIGKTMFAKKASLKALDQKLFDPIILVTVSQVPNVEKIQQEIAEKLGLKLEEKSESSRAGKLQLTLSSEKKILIIFDDVWKKLELHDIGIYFGSDQKGCKILLTSRYQHVVRDMGAESFKLKLLSNNESDNLFYKTVGDSTKGQDLQLIAEQIIEECACLPIAIVVVAAALKNKPCYYWEDALQGLRKAIPTSVEEMDEKVYKSVRLSYDFLRNHEAQYLLLLCSIHQEDEDIKVEDLVKYGIGLDQFQGITTLKDARNRVLKLVYDLKAACLLLDDKSETFVKMHDVIRDVCLSIASSQDERMHFIRDVVELEECIRNNKLVNSVAISLPSVNVNLLPKRLECFQLKLLLIRHVDHMGITSQGSLDEQFFKEMKELRVLSLRNVEVKLTCFSQLQNLQTLRLWSCIVGDIAPIGELKKLKILNFWGSDILELPREIGQLTLLRSLVLLYCGMIDHFEPHVISSLKNLEELNMEQSFSRWKSVKGERSNASLVELNDLDQLTTLMVYIPDVSTLPIIWIKTNLERYQIIIGDWSNVDSYELWHFHDYELWHFRDYEFSTSSESRYCRPTSKMLKLKLEKSHLVKDHGIENLIKSAKELCLHEFEDLNDVVLELDKDGFPQLEHFMFQNNGSVRYIINSSNPCNAFLNLKSMFLEHMMNLEKICQGKLIAGSFSKLKKVSVRGCPRIKWLFSFSIAKQFEEIQVQDCRALEEIGSGHESEYESSNANNEASNERNFCQLTTLRLICLPKVTRFFQPEVETISMSERGEGSLIVDSPMRLFSEKVIFLKLTHIELSGLKVGKLWLDDVNGESFMLNLTKLIVHKCGKLNCLLSYNVAKGLKLLEHLEVKYCNALEEVIAIKTPLEEMLLPKLQTLVLCDLQKLSRFSSECCIEYTSLKVLKIGDCPHLRDFVVIEELNNLEELDFSNCISIVKLPQGIERLTQLKKLKLQKCKSLKTIQPNVLSKLIHLQELDLYKSPVTWESEGVVSGEGSNASLAELKILPKLTSLSLSLPDLSIVPKDVFSEKLDFFCIEIGISSPKLGNWWRPLEVNALILNLKKSELVWEYGLQGLLKRCKNLHLNGFEDENDFLYHLEYKELLSQYGRVVVTSCARFKHLFQYSFSSTILLWALRVEDCEGMEAIITHERDLDNDYQHPNDRNFNKLELSFLGTLTLKNLPRLEQFYLKVKTSVISHPSNEPSDEEFEVSVPFFSRNVHMPKLLTLEMELLGCKQIWHHQPPSNFNKLRNLKVSCCDHLKSLMSYSMATSLVSLICLEVCNCEKMEEVISTSESRNEESLDLILFPKVEMLIIKDLPKLQRFSATNSFICPSLSHLTLTNCVDLSTFVDFSTHAPAKQALFGGKGIFPSLVSLEVNHHEILNDIFNLEGESSVNSFGMLKRLCLESVVLPLEVVQRFQNLRELCLSGIASEKLFQHQELRAAEENENILPRLKTLVLWELPKLLHMFDEDVHLTKVISNLEIVDIIRCYQLKSLIPPLMSFQYYLKTLRVTECHGLKNLFASVVKGLVNLKEMSIYGCEGMMEIVGKDEVELVSEIVFQKLETLALHNLPNLKCFYCENSTLTFPNLKKLVISQCPEMQAFSHGIVNSPILDKVITEYNWNYYYKGWEGEMIISHHFKGFKYGEVKEECWEHNINDTIRNIFEQRSQFNQFENASGD